MPMLDNQNLLNAYRMDEAECLNTLFPLATLPKEKADRVQARAHELVTRVRSKRLKKGGLDAFLNQYDLSSDEGVALMCLAEALLRIPDTLTIEKLIRDKLTAPDWEQHLGKSHSLFVNAATWGLLITGKVLNQSTKSTTGLVSVIKNWVGRTGEPIIRQAVSQAMKILGNQFVMATNIEEALKRAQIKEKQGYRYSYDMLGEAAKTKEDATTYFRAYFEAIEAIGDASQGLGPIQGPGVSVKLSALHPRYEWVNRDRVMRELLPNLKELALLAKEENIGFTIDAEEADRLDLSLMLIEAIVKDTAFKGWEGFGLAVQAYQKRAIHVIDWVQELAKHQERRLMVRLVKGAYWDSEIKWAQERGLKYPVFTRKSSTDVSYLACAQKLLEKDRGPSKNIFPQFATHNAYSVAYILEMVGKNRDFEFQCLHGMGDTLYDNIVGKELGNDVPCRVYAPVGIHEHLLPYLVRRLLENGANTSFVNKILNEETPIEELTQDPVQKTILLPSKPHPKIPLPINLYLPDRLNSQGLDLSNPNETDTVLMKIKESFPRLLNEEVPKVGAAEVEEAITKAHHAFSSWEKTKIAERAVILDKTAELIEQNRIDLMALLIREGGKTVQDAVSEVREAADFCRYYSARLKVDFKPKILPGPTGEQNQLSLHGRGVIACISPWNFPLAIFLGQVTAALAAGNTVISKPASQTPKIAKLAVSLLHQAGVPKNVVQCVVGQGSVIGARLTEDPRIQGIMFTGSTETARDINQKLAARPGPMIPFIAETGGQNAMIVDSSALPEQVVSDVLLSAFGSAGQRCSALRVLYIQEDVYDRMITMLKGAMAELSIGDPLELSTDVGPVIDESAKKNLLNHSEKMMKEAKPIYECVLPTELPHMAFFAPRAFQIKNISVLTGEVFGPILHVISFKAENLSKVIDDINNTGYGLTLGIHSRIDETIEFIHTRLRVGNTYVNRSMIGAVVGVQPFGGEGLSGTGPKAGGPNILTRLATERTLSINIAASGGNMALMSLSEE